MAKLSLWTKLYLGLAAFSIAGSFLTAKFGLDPGPIKPAAQIATLLCGFLALMPYAQWQRILAVLLIGAAAEVFGVYTGIPFGPYRYTDNWVPVVDLPGSVSFPILVPFAWLLVAGGCALAMRPLGRPALFLAPLTATLIDFLMEPVMADKLRYWIWQPRGPLPGGAHWLNLVGWFATSLLAAKLLAAGSKRKGDDPVWVVGGFVALVLGLWVAG